MPGQKNVQKNESHQEGAKPMVIGTADLGVNGGVAGDGQLMPRSAENFKEGRSPGLIREECVLFRFVPSVQPAEVKNGKP